MSASVSVKHHLLMLTRASSSAVPLLTLCCPPSPPGCTEEVPDGAQEQRGEFGEVPGRAKETAPEEPGQQAPVQIWGQGDAGQCVSVCVGQCKCVQLLQWINKEKSRCLWITSIRMAICRTSFKKMHGSMATNASAKKM